MKLNCLIVDDEPVARKGLEEYIKEVDFLHLAGKCENAMKASSFLNDGRVDLILLDIHMPKLSGVDFLKALKNPPMIIFTTAYSEYALEGYALDIIDYLVKPIPFDRFLKAVQKARDFFELKQKAGVASTGLTEYFFIKCDHKYEKVNYSEVLYVEAMQNYCIIHTTARRMIAYLTFSGLESQLPADRFLKVHKSFLVSLDKVKALDGHEIIIGTTRIPVSRNLKEEVMKRIMGDNLFSRS
jgi:DNA-binding LytR/AlgR family response regulator